MPPSRGHDVSWYTWPVNVHAKTLSKILFIDLVGSVAWFPIWWYSRGLFHVIEWMRRELAYRVREYAFRVWIKNFFVPMYGQHDWTGRIISVFMRFVVLIGRAIALCIEAIVYAVFLVVWALAPILTLLFFLSGFIRGAFIDQVRGLY